MRKSVAVFCALFVFLVSGHAQSNRIGVYINPQYSFYNKTEEFSSGYTSTQKGRGFAFSGGAYYEKSFGLISWSIGAGYTHQKMNITLKEGDTLSAETTVKMGFMSVPISFSYDYPIKEDKFIIGLFARVSAEFLLKETVTVLGSEVPMNMSQYKFREKLHLMGMVGFNVMYFFTDNFGAAITPNVSLLMSMTEKPNFFGLGCSVRLFYAFGY